MKEAPSPKLAVQDIIDHSSGEDGKFDAHKAWEHLSTIVQLMSSIDLAELIKESEEIFRDNPQWRQLVELLRQLHTSQTKAPSIFRLIHPGNLIRFAQYSTHKKALQALYEDSYPAHCRTFMQLHSLGEAKTYIDTILASENALPAFINILIATLRDIDSGLAPQTIRKRNGRANLRVV
ncbi:hypothetical protein JKY72_06830 [Candidatus Gracilibacteria bacterium]|nr:hypothetical protein [Candidatus Gracilibacteria bacterium]